MSYVAGSLLAPGTTVAGYRIETLIGRGGMGAVYRAEEAGLHRKVALKVIAPELAQDARFRERFLRESQIAASLDHPHVIPLYQAGEEEGVLFLAMRYVEGTDLAKLLAQEGALEPKRALDLLAQVAEALDAAHEQGLVHRDVKPSNVLIASSAGKEHCYLADFGLTKRTGSLSGVTAAGDIVGTLEYVAPEQITGEPLDERSDVYSLGCVLYECLAGQPPFPRATDVALLWAHVHEESERASTLRPGLPRELDSVLTRALAKEPGRRYRTAGELVAATRSALGFEAAPLSRRVRRWVLALAALAVAGAVAATLAFVFGRGAEALSSISADAVGVVDPESGKLVGEVLVGARPGPVAVGEEAVWVANESDETVSRIDPERRSVVQTTAIGAGPSGIAAGGGAVWVVNGLDGTVSRISSETNQVVQTIDLGNGARDLAVGEGAVWVTNVHDRSVVRLDPSSGRVQAKIRAGAAPSGIAVGGSAVWLANEADGSVSRVDPRRNEVVERIPVGNGPSAIAVGGGAVWVANRLDATVSRIDPATNAVIATVPVGGEPSDLAFVNGSVWVASEYSRTISRVKPGNNTVGRTVLMGNGPVALGGRGDRLWVTVRSAGAEHRGGTLRLVGHGGPETFDPALAVRFDTIRYLHLTGDGLTGLRRVGGGDGNTLVPDLAVALPRPTDGGRTYTFRLRPGIRYSSGQVVRPGDFRRALERVFGLGSFYASDFKAVVGAEACLARPRHCNLVRGVDTTGSGSDVSGGTVTFRLREPDPEFLYKLTLPAAFPVPRGTPVTDLGTDGTIPGTGPYMIAGPPYWDKRQLRFVRNPHFREWSRAAQPQGYADEIVVEPIESDTRKIREVVRGQADALILPPPVGTLAELRSRYPTQLHTNAPLQVLFMVLNTQVPPFDSLDVRRAVNYAVDRERTVDLIGGPLAAQPICQLQLPNFPGYVRYCPYTSRPANDGAWRGPDPAKAKRLVAASGTAGIRVVVWAPEFEPLKLFGSHVASVLRTLGYRVSVRHRGDDYFPTVSDPRRRVQIWASGVGAPYPAASIFLRGMRCSPPNEYQFCDPRIDAEIDRALALQTTDPDAANALWARIDHRITDRAPFLFLVATNWPDFVSKRVGNYQFHPMLGMLWSQAWVQ